MGAAEPRRGDAEPGHRERLREQLLLVDGTFCQDILFAALRSKPRLSLVNLQVKCAQYWPQREERDSVFEDTHFKLTLVSEDIKSYYTVRQLELENLTVSAAPRAPPKRNKKKSLHFIWFFQE